ncbi:hypothetical protein MUV96_001528, partial [Campylobacter lari]|nr:hypothetical protein [Campylobacter lari]
MLSQTLKQFIDSISISNAYYEFEESDIFILDNDDIRQIFIFQNEKIFIYENNNLSEFSKDKFLLVLKNILQNEKIKIQAINSSIEKRENLILENQNVKNFLTKYFTLKVRLSKSYKLISSILEACKMCHSKQHFMKKNLKTILINLGNLERSIKENITRLESIYTYINT